MTDDQGLENIKVLDFLTFGMLHCQDRPNNKVRAAALYMLLQGSEEAQPQISAADKDFKPVFDKIFEFAAILPGICSNSRHIDEHTDALKAAFPEIRGDDEEEDSVIDAIFGVQSRVNHAVFIEAVSTDHPWVMNPT